MMWFLGILWACICFLCGIGWDIFIWLWQEIPIMMFLMSVGIIYMVVLVFGLIGAIFDILGALFK